jgi:hypothetical protein
MNHWNRRIAVAAVLASLSAPALAADPAQDCTVCRDPMWPTLVQPMPGIALNMPAESNDPGAIRMNETRQTAPARSNGIGVAAVTVAGSSIYRDPMWPQVQGTSGGMAASNPSAPAPAPRAAPVVAAGTVAAR